MTNPRARHLDLTPLAGLPRLGSDRLFRRLQCSREPIAADGLADFFCARTDGNDQAVWADTKVEIARGRGNR